MVRAVFRPEAELTLFMRMRTKEIVKNNENVLRQTSYFPVTGKDGSSKRMARSDFWPEVPK